MLKIELNSVSAHQTISVYLEEKERFVDLYYYCLDYSLIDHEQSIAKGFLNFFLMLENWKVKIRALTPNEITFLPFDYSDQYIGFFLLERLSIDEMTIQYAYTTDYIGANAAPSQLHTINLLDKPYRLIDQQYTYSLTMFLQELESSIDTLLTKFYKRNLSASS